MLPCNLSGHGAGLWLTYNTLFLALCAVLTLNTKQGSIGDALFHNSLFKGEVGYEKIQRNDYCNDVHIIILLHGKHYVCRRAMARRLFPTAKRWAACFRNWSGWKPRMCVLRRKKLLVGPINWWHRFYKSQAVNLRRKTPGVIWGYWL